MKKLFIAAILLTALTVSAQRTTDPSPEPMDPISTSVNVKTSQGTVTVTIKCERQIGNTTIQSGIGDNGLYYEITTSVVRDEDNKPRVIRAVKTFNYNPC